MVGRHRSQTIRLADIENRLRWDRENYRDPVYAIKELIAAEDEFAIRFIYTARDAKSGNEVAVDVVYFYHLRGEK